MLPTEGWIPACTSHSAELQATATSASQCFQQHSQLPFQPCAVSAQPLALQSPIRQALADLVPEGGGVVALHEVAEFVDEDVLVHAWRGED